MKQKIKNDNDDDDEDYKYECGENSIYSLKSIVPGFLKTELAKISTHSTTWQFKTIKLVQRPIKSLYRTPGSKLSPNLE